MQIQNLKLENFRGAQSLPLELDPQLNVFVGLNGTGKSSILDASALLLSWLVNRLKHAGASGRPISETDIKNGESSANLEATVCLNGSSFKWNITKVRKGHARKEVGSLLGAVSEVAKQMNLSISESNEQIDIALFVYYPVNRAVVDIPLRIKERHSFDLLSAFDDSLTSAANFRTFFEWFREREDLENEKRRDQELGLVNASNGTFPDPQLQTVRKALSLFLKEFRNLTVRRSPLRMEVEKNGKRLTVNQLSDGEKCLMAMVGDLARRMAIANPLRENPLEGYGIVLIDEIDLHLHPKWQAMVIPRLSEVFPHCQFLISTHSPHVINHVKPKHLFLLEQGAEGLKAHRSSESYGKTVERVLEDLMGLETTRPHKVKVAFNQIFAQIEQGDLDGAKGSIRELESLIGADPDLVTANLLIKRKELIGR